MPPLHELRHTTVPQPTDVWPMQTHIDLFNYLLRQRIVFLSGYVNDKVGVHVCPIHAHRPMHRPVLRPLTSWECLSFALFGWLYI